MVVQRERLDEQHHAVVGEMFACMTGCRHRIAHVMQAIEEADQVVGAVVLGRLGDLERRAIGEPGILDTLSRRLDRRCMEVDPDERRLRERFGHRDDRRTVAASHIGHTGTSGHALSHTVECRDPLARQMCPIPRTEEPLGPGEQARMVITPRHRPSPPERRLHLLEVDEQRTERVHRAGDEHGRLIIGECHCMLRREHVGVGSLVVGQDPAGGLTVEPLPHETFVAFALDGEPMSRHRAAFGEYSVETQLVAEPDSETQGGSGHVSDELPHELLDTRLINRLRVSSPLLAVHTGHHE